MSDYELFIVVMAYNLVSLIFFAKYQWGFIGRVDDRFSDIESRLSKLEKEDRK